MHFFTWSDFYIKANLQIPITVYYYGILRVEVVYFFKHIPPTGAFSGNCELCSCFKGSVSFWVGLAALDVVQWVK